MKRAFLVESQSLRSCFAGAREVAEEGEEAALVGVGEGFEVVEDEEGASASVARLTDCTVCDWE